MTEAMEDIEFLELELLPEEVDRLKEKYDCVFQITRRKDSNSGSITSIGDLKSICKAIGAYLGQLALDAHAGDESLDVEKSLKVIVGQIMKYAEASLGVSGKRGV